MKTKFGISVIYVVVVKGKLKQKIKKKNKNTQLVAACVRVAFGFNGFQPSSSVIMYTRNIDEEFVILII